MAAGKSHFFSCKLKCWAPRISWLGTFGLLEVFLDHSLDYIAFHLFCTLYAVLQCSFICKFCLSVIVFFPPKKNSNCNWLKCDTITTFCFLPRCEWKWNWFLRQWLCKKSTFQYGSMCTKTCFEIEVRATCKWLLDTLFWAKTS